MSMDLQEAVNLLEDCLDDLQDDPLFSPSDEEWLRQEDPVSGTTSVSSASSPSRVSLHHEQDQSPAIVVPPFPSISISSWEKAKQHTSAAPDSLGDIPSLDRLPPLRPLSDLKFGAYDEEDEDDDDLDDEDCDDKNNKGRKRRRTKNNNPDAELIAKATEENLLAMNIDPDSKEGKKQKRRIRNRMSAMFHRERKKEFIRELQGMVRERDGRILELETIIRAQHRELSVRRPRSADATAYRRPQIEHEMSSGNTSAIEGSDSEGSDTTRGSGMRATMNTYSQMNDPYDSSHSGDHSLSDDSHHFQPVMRSFSPGFSLLSVALMCGFTFFGDPPIYGTSGNTNPFDMKEEAKLVGLPTMFHQNEFEHNSAALASSTPPVSSRRRKLLSVSSEEESEALREMDDVDVANVKASQGKYVIPSEGKRAKESNAYEFAVMSNYHASQEQAPEWQYVSSEYDTDREHEEMPVILSYPDLVGPHQALWKYQNRAIHLYPSLQKAVSGVRSAPLSNTLIRPVESVFKPSGPGRKVPHRNLRSRDDGIRQSQPTGSGLAAGYVGSHFNGLIPSQHSHTGSIGEGTPSQVLMTHGRALLNPKLALHPLPIRAASMRAGDADQSDIHVPHRPQRILRTPTEEYEMQQEMVHGEAQEEQIERQATSVKPVAVFNPPRWQQAESSDSTGRGVVSVPSYVPQAVPGEQPRVILDPMSTSQLPESSSVSDPQMMLMVLPASSVRWGTNWADSTAFSSLVKDNQSSSQGHGDTSGDDSGSENYWVEIGCSVFRAQIVKNITMNT